MIKRFDLVSLKTIRNVTYLNGPAGRPSKPSGNWIVVYSGTKEDRLLLAKDETIIQIPKSDVLKVANYDLKKILEVVKSIRTFDDLQKLQNKGAVNEQGQGQERQEQRQKRR
jgi:hypothetical protein